MAEGGVSNAQLFTEVMKEFENAVNTQNHPMPKLREFLDRYDGNKLKKLRELISKHNLSLLLHNELNEHRRKEVLGPAAGQSTAISVYEFVQDKLNRWTQEGDKLPPDKKLSDAARDSPIDELNPWSAELWFIRQLGSCEGDDDIEDWIRGNGSKELFEKYFHVLDDDGQARFTTLTEKNASDLLKGLIRVGNVAEYLSTFLEDFNNVHKITDDGPSKEITSTYSHHSKRYHIIPPPRPGWRMYGMHFYLKNFFEPGTRIPNKAARESAVKEAKCIRKAFKDSRFELRGPRRDQFNPENGTFAQLETWLRPTLERIKSKCSMLFLSFSCHGAQGQIQDTVQNLLAIQRILHWIHDEELRGIPKVVVIQACQNVPNPREKAKCDEIFRRLENFVEGETQNMRLLLAVEKGEKYLCKYFKSYLLYFSKGLGDPSILKEPTAPAMHEYSHAKLTLDSQKADSAQEKAEKTTIHSSDSRHELLPRTQKTPVEDEFDENSSGYISEDDGQEWITVTDDEL